MVQGVKSMASQEQTLQQARATFADLAEACIFCGACTERCSLLHEPGWNIQSVCRAGSAVVNEAETTGDLRQALANSGNFLPFIMSCLGCARCTAVCPEDLAMTTPCPFIKRSPDSAEYGVKYGPIIAESDLCLCRMHIDINCFKRQINK